MATPAPPPGFQLVNRGAPPPPPGFQLVKKGTEPQGPVDFDAMEMLSNIPKSAYNYGAGIVSAVAHPVQTAKAIGGLAQSVGNKIGRNAAELVYGQEMEPMPEHSEAMADATGQAIKGRYGSIDALKTTAMQDPVGMLSDVSGAAMAGKIPTVARIGAAVDPVNLATNTAKAVGKAVIPEGAAQKLYQSAAKFSTTLSPEKRAAIIQTALDNGYMPTSKGVAKVEDRIDILNHQLDDLIEGATAQGAKIPVNAVFLPLKELRKTKGGVKIEAGSDVAAIDRIAGEFHRSLNGRKFLTPEELQAFKVDAYNKIAWDSKRMAGSPIKEDTFKAMARGAKDAIAKAIPEATDINQELGGLYELNKHLPKAANRLDNRNLISINAPLNVGAGGIAGAALGSGPAGMAAGAVSSLLGSPRVKAKIAIALNKIKEGDVGWLENNLTAAEIRVALTLAGRAEEQASDLQASQ